MFKRRPTGWGDINSQFLNLKNGNKDYAYIPIFSSNFKGLRTFLKAFIPKCMGARKGGI